MSSIGQFVTSQDGTQIWADHTGNTKMPAVILIAGFSCSALVFEKQWKDQELLQNLHLVRYDVRGQGQSDQPEDEAAYLSSRQAEDFKAVCNAFDLHKPFIAGWSAGATMPADVVAYYGADFISGVIIIGGNPYKSMFEQVAKTEAVGLIQRVLTTDMNLWHQAGKDFIASLVAYPNRMPTETKYMWLGAVAGQSPTARNLVAARPQNPEKLLAARETLPYLLLEGKLDVYFHVDKLVAFMNETFRNVEIRLFEECGHAAFYDLPEDIGRALLEFVQRVGIDK